MQQPFRSLVGKHVLIVPNSNLGIIWSPRCGCNKVMLWYYSMLNLLDAAAVYSWNPHKYRERVLTKAVQYRRWRRDASSRIGSIEWHQFVRDPVGRAISIYRHYLIKGRFDPRVSRILGKQVTSTAGYSLDDFLTYVERSHIEDLKGRAEHHVRLQRPPLADHFSIHLIPIDRTDMYTAMNNIAAAHGLPITEFDQIPAFAADDQRSAKPIHNPNYRSSDVLDKHAALHAWPVHAAIVGPIVRDRIQQLYKNDMAYIYPASSGNDPH